MSYSVTTEPSAQRGRNSSEFILLVCSLSYKSHIEQCAIEKRCYLTVFTVKIQPKLLILTPQLLIFTLSTSEYTTNVPRSSAYCMWDT